MAKTIKEMAHDHRVMVANSDDYYAPEDNFEAGANAVLECFERAIELNESTFVYSREKYIKVQVLNELIEKIRVK